MYQDQVRYVPIHQVRHVPAPGAPCTSTWCLGGGRDAGDALHCWVGVGGKAVDCSVGTAGGCLGGDRHARQPGWGQARGALQWAACTVSWSVSEVTSTAPLQGALPACKAKPWLAVLNHGWLYAPRLHAWLCPPHLHAWLYAPHHTARVQEWPALVTWLPEDWPTCMQQLMALGPHWQELLLAGGKDAPGDNCKVRIKGGLLLPLGDDCKVRIKGGMLLPPTATATG